VWVSSGEKGEKKEIQGTAIHPQILLLWGEGEYFLLSFSVTVHGEGWGGRESAIRSPYSRGRGKEPKRKKE